MSKGYRDLEIYRLSHKLAVEVHKRSLSLPKFEMYEEGDQIRRSSKSICSNIVEGYGRRKYKKEFIQFLIYAIASCDETSEHLNLLFETNSLKNADVYEGLIANYDKLGKKMNVFLQAVEKTHNVF